MAKEQPPKGDKQLAEIKRLAKLYAAGTCFLTLVIVLVLCNILSGGELMYAMRVGWIRPDFAVFLAVSLGVVLLLLVLMYKYTRNYYMPVAAKHINDRARAEKRAQERQEEQTLGFTYQAADSFYAECLKKNIPALDTQVRIQRAQLLAQSRAEWNIPNVEERYKDLFHTGEQRAAAAERQKADQDRGQEKWIAEKAEKLLAYKGREKRIQMLQELLDKAKARQDAAFQADFNLWRMNKALSDATMEKEKDWSIPAGLASGIGGTAAGVAVAGDIASQNAGIRQRNEARKAAFDAQQNAAFEASMKRNKGLNSSVSTLTRQLEEAKLKLTDETVPAAKLLASLKVSQVAVSATKGGLIQVRADVQPMRSWQISGEIKGYIDGTIAAKIYRDGQADGQAYLTLPVFGLPYGEATVLEGICTEEYRSGGAYRVELEPAELWVIEK